MFKCTGCGVQLQTNNICELGYTKDIKNCLCERCFRVKNYNEYRKVTKENSDFIDILNEICLSGDLVILVVDLFNIKDFNIIKKYIKNNILLVLTKKDIMPNVYDEKLKKYFDNIDLNMIDMEVISSKKNYNFDSLYYKINKYKLSNNVYVLGYTNAGKSTMINKILYDYSDNKVEITTSNLPNTTLDMINIKVNDNLNLIDTPGLLSNGDIINYVGNKLVNRIIPQKKIKPLSYNIRINQIFIIEDIFRLDINKGNSIVFYISNELKINRIYNKSDKLNELEKKEIIVSDYSDIVIEGLGFIKIMKKCKLILYIISGVNVFTRRSLI